MILLLALAEILCLVLNIFVNTTISVGSSDGSEHHSLSCIRSLVLARYSTAMGRSLWRLLGFIMALLFWALFGASFAFDASCIRSNSNSGGGSGGGGGGFFIAWKCVIIIVITLNILYVAGSHTLTTKERPFYLDIHALNVLFLVNIALFIYGQTALDQINVISNIPFLILFIIQVADIACLALIYSILAITFWLGREGHGASVSDDDSGGNEHNGYESSKGGIETSESSPFLIDFVDLRVIIGQRGKSCNYCGINSDTDSSSNNIDSRKLSADGDEKISACIGMSVLPGRCRGRVQRDVTTDLSRIRSHYKIDTIISLMPDEQLREMKVPNLQKAVQDNGMFSILAGWRDKWIPSFSTLESTITLVNAAMDRLTRNGDKILIHCMGGKGRTGLVVTCLLINLGYSLPEAIAATRNSRRGCIHNPLQLYYLNWYFNYYNSNYVSSKGGGDESSINRSQI